MQQGLYTLINDDCDICNFISNAFSLLKLPLSSLSFSDATASLDDNQHLYALLICPHLEEYQKERILSLVKVKDLSLIEFIENNTIESKHPKHHQMNYPFTESELKHILASCSHEFEANNSLIQESEDQQKILEKLIGTSVAIKNIRRMILQVAESNSTVLVLGQSGTGKEVIANAIHLLSSRREQTFVPINCGAIPAELIESELFGNEKGAYTGAATAKPGRFELANKGSIFLDEIGDMPLSMQVKLLRVLQDKKIDRIGSTKSIQVDVRLIAATNKDLIKLISENLFREDLFYRLNVFPIYVPNLQQRKDDIPYLIDYHLNKIFDRLQHRIAFTDDAMNILINYNWPGNIRELENFLERMVILHRDSVINADDIDPLYKELALKNTYLTHKNNAIDTENKTIDIADEDENPELAMA